jgi:adenylate cyclase
MLMNTLVSILGRLQKSRLALMATVVAVGSMLGILVSNLAPFETLELKTLDYRFRYGSHPEWADTNVVIVAIDQKSLDFFESTRGLKWPWPREYYGLMLRFLQHAHPRVVAFDYDFSQKDEDRLEVDGSESDAAFADAMATSGRVVLGFNLAYQEKEDRPGDPILPKHLIPRAHDTTGLPLFDRAISPLESFQKSAAALGATNFDSDDDGIARHSNLMFGYNDSQVPQIAFAADITATGNAVWKADSILGTIPRDDNGRFLIYWYGRGGPGGSFRYYSAHSLIVSGVKMLRGLEPDISPEIFRNKCVFVGGSASGLWDFKPTPFTYLEIYPGVEIQATLLSNLLNHHFITATPGWASILLAVLLTLIAAFLFTRVRRVWLASILVALVVVGYGIIAFYLFRWELIWLPIVSPVFTVATTYALLAVTSYAVEGQQRRMLRRAFNRYFSPHVVADILDNSAQVELGGKMLEATAFFSDIKDFTSFAEKTAPKELVHFLNQYFSVASDVILRNEAMLDKYIGDAIMAIFGAPIPRHDHAKVACLTALEVQEVLSAYHAHPDRDPGMPVFVTRIGLHTGNMVIGNIGSSSRLDYTAIGDTVNVASRLEGVNKVFGTRIIISETTYEQATDVIAARPLDFLKVKGKAIPIRIFELVGRSGAVPQLQTEIIGFFNEGLQLYRQREFGRAAGIFKRVQEIDPNPVPSALYLKRCAELSEQKLPEDWDGVYTMTSK